MVCLIRNLTQITVGEKLPLQTDTSDGADLSRVKYYRNKLVHSEKVAVSDKPFQEYWTDISEAIIRLGGSKYKLICREIEARQLGDDDKKLLTEIRNISRSYDPIPKGMRVINDQKVEEWIMESVIETRAIKQMCKLTIAGHVVVAVGPSGCGKSTAIHRVAVKLIVHGGFSIVPVYSAEKIVELYNPDRRQVFVIGDLCGKATIDTYKVQKWYDLSNDIIQILKNSHVRILASCRTHIFQDRLFQPIKLLRKATCDFLSDEYCLTNKERESISNIYLKEEETRHLLECPERLNFECVPLLCCLYSQNRTGQIIDFFTNPAQVIRDELNLLWEAPDQKTYGTLILFIVYNNFLPIALLNKTSGIKSILEEISDGLHLKSVFSIKAVMSELANLQNSYVKKHANGYSIIHDKIFDILVCFHGEHDFELTIGIAHTDVIRDRLVMTSLSENDSYGSHENVLVIPVEKEEIYFDRLFKDVDEGFLENIFLNKNLSCATYRQKLIQHFKGTSDFSALLRQMSCKKTYILILSMLHKGFCDIVPLLITEHIDLNINNKISETPLFLAVNKGYNDIVDLFLKYNADSNISP
ncbi:uncharacterized protein LOC134710450 [Mytilus trossulus]|uniref:uncharacterized protein LOC134710450 n=1 Tax=Mytilus trossulus TaxID=6551 RepID=UPI00300470C8